MSNTNPEFFDSEQYSLEKKNFIESLREARTILREGSPFFHKAFLEELLEQSIEFHYYRYAAKIARTLLSISPYDSDLWFQLGICYTSLGKYTSALRAFRKAHSLNPADPETLIELADAYYHLKRYDRAETLLEQALVLDSNKEFALLSLAKIYQKRKQYKKALQYFYSVLDVNPESTEALFQIALSYEYQHNYQGALESYDKYLDIVPHCPIGWFNRGIVLEKLNKSDEAVKSYEFSAALDTHFVDPRFNLGNLYADAGRVIEALAMFDEVIHLDPEDETAFFNIATIYEESGDFRTALQFYSKALAIDDEYQDAYLGKGLCHLKLLETDLSIHNFGMALGSNVRRRENWNPEQCAVETETALRKMEEYYSLLMKQDTPERFPKIQQIASLLAGYKGGTITKEIVNYLLSLKPTDAMNYFILAKMHFLQGESRKGLENLQKAFSYDKEMLKYFSGRFPAVAASRLFREILDGKIL